MFEQDYLMRMLLQFTEAMKRSLLMATEKRNPQVAAEMLETAIGDATDIDGGVLLSLAPESMASILQVSGTDPKVTEYIARSLLLEAEYLKEAGQEDMAAVRDAQAHGLAEAFGFEVSLDFLSDEKWEKLSSEENGDTRKKSEN